MKRKAQRVRSEGSIPSYVTEAESRKQHSDSPLCNSLKRRARTHRLVCPSPVRVEQHGGDAVRGVLRTVRLQLLEYLHEMLTDVDGVALLDVDDSIECVADEEDG